MVKRLLGSIPLILLVLTAEALAQNPPASAGREFYVSLPSTATGPGHSMRINITAVRSATATIRRTETGAVETASINPGERWERVIPRDSILIGMGEHTSRRSLIITSTDLVTVNVVSDAAALSDGYTALPTESLGFDYVAMAYPGITTSGQPPIFFGVVNVIATRDTTTVRIVPSEVTAAGNLPGIQYSVMLRRGEVYQIVPSSADGTDLTGTTITADKPVAVISGHGGVTTLDPNSAINSMLDQMVPVTDWGSRFYAVTLPGQPHGRYRIYARTDGTRVVVNGAPLVTLDAGEVHEFTAPGSLTFECSAPVMLVQVCIHRPRSADLISSDPSIMVVNPTDSYDRAWVWSTPTMPTRIASGGIDVGWNHFVVITAPSVSRSSVRLDGNVVNFQWPHSDGAFHTATVQVAPGPHTITAPAPVNAQIFGESDFDAYAMPAGMRLREPFRAEPIEARLCDAVLDTFITLRNQSADPIQVISATFAAGSASQFVSPTLPFPIGAGVSRQVRVRVALPRFGLNRDTLTLRTETSGARPLVIPIEIVRDSLAIETAVSAMRFDPATSANPTRDTTIAVVNRGTAPLEIRRIDFTGPFSRLSPPLPAVIAPGETLQVRVRFAPPSSGEYGGTMMLVPAPCGDPRSVSLSGVRLRPSSLVVRVDTIPVLTCDPPGFTETRVVIRNTGGEPLRFDSLEVRGPDTRAFSIAAPAAGTMIGPGDSIVATLRFVATAAGSYQVTLRVWNGSSFDGYELIGPFPARRESAEIESVGSLDFGISQGCDSPPTRTLEIRNRGTVPVVLDSIIVGESFTVSGGLNEVPPGGSVTITITYAPQQPGLHRDTLRVYASPCDQILAAELTAEQRGAALTAPDSIDLGPIPDCTLPRRDTITVRNGGAVPLTIGDVTASGGASVVAVLERAIQPGQDARIVIELNGASGEVLGDITVAVQPCDISRLIALRARVIGSALEITGPIDFGLVQRDVPVVRSAALVNSGEVDLRIDRIEILPARNGLLVVQPATPLTLAAGASVPIQIELRSSLSGTITSMVSARSDSPCVVTGTLAITGAVGGVASITVSLPDTSGWVDSLIALPLLIEKTAGTNDPASVVAGVQWDRTMLELVDVRPRSAGVVRLLRNEIDGAARAVAVEYAGPIGSDGAVVELIVRVLLGSAESTPLIVDTVHVTPSAPGDVLQGLGRNGRFTTLGICMIGGVRLVRVNGVFAVTKLAPNPASDRLDVELVGGGRGVARLQLVDALGRPAILPVVRELSAGVQGLQLDLSNLAPGTYILHLESGPRRESHIVTVVR